MSNGIEMRDLQAMRGFISMLHKFERDLGEMTIAMTTQVEAAEEWWTDPQYYKFRESWSESFGQLHKFMNDIPSYTQHLSEFADGVEDLLRRRLGPG